MGELLPKFENGGADAASVLDELSELFIAVDSDVEHGVAIDPDTAYAYGYAAMDLADIPERPPRMGSTIDTLKRAAKVTREHKLIDHAAEIEYRVAHLLLVDGHVAEAEQRLGNAIDELKEAKAKLPWLYLEYAQCARSRGNRREAQERIDIAGVLSAAARDTPLSLLQRVLEALIVGVKAQILIDLGLADRAAPLVAKETEWLSQGATAEALAAFWLHQSALLCATDNHARLLEQLRPLFAGDEFKTFPGLARAQLQFFFGCALAEHAHEQPELAAEARTTFEHVLSDSNLDARSRWFARAHLADLERRAKDFSRAAELLRDLRKEFAANATEPGADGALLNALEARLALDSGADIERRKELLTELETAFTRFLDEWEAVPERSEGVGFLVYSERRAILAELVRLELDVLGPEAGATKALEQLVRAQALGSLARSFGGEPVTFAMARRELCTDRAGVLEFLPGPERSFVFAFDAEHLVCKELAASRTWEQARKEWLVLLSHAPREGEDLKLRRKSIDDLGLRIRDALLPPEARERLLAWDDVAIVGIDLLGCTPFDVLPLDGQKTLGYALATTYLPSLTVGVRLSERARAQLGTSLRLDVLAAPSDPSAAGELGLHWTPIEWNAAHERRLRAAYGVEGVRIFAGDRASLSTLRSLSSALDGGVVEILAHGFYDAASEPPAGIALAPCSESNGLVHAAELTGLKLGPLVVLAVCGAGRAPLRSGDDGVSNLGGAFFKAGAQCVVLSPVDLAQAPTEDLLDEFHARVARGESPAHAMRAARRKLLDGERYSDPFYNSMLQVVGLGSRPLVSQGAELPSSASPWPIVATVLIAGVLIAACIAGVLTSLARRRRAHQM